MAVKVAIWNVQNFGSKGDPYQYQKGSDSSVLVQFIADVVTKHTIDVLMMLEVFRTAGDALESLRVALNKESGTNAWCYDWVKGSVLNKEDVKPAELVQAPADLDWSGSSAGTRSEGYAVVWRDDQRTRFTMLPASRGLSEGRMPPDPAAPHMIELNLYGRPFDRTTDAPGVKSTEGFDPKVPATNWVPSKYPEAGKAGNRFNKLLWKKVRRPAVATIELPGGRRVPIVAYHAPSFAQVARMATYVSGLARELYVDVKGPVTAYNPDALAGGDYNVDPTDSDDWWPVAYRKYYQPFSPALGDLEKWDAGADMVALNTNKGTHETTVRVNESKNGIPNAGPPILNERMRFFYYGRLDNLFYRGLTMAKDSPKSLVLPLLVMGTAIDKEYGPLTNAPVKRLFQQLVDIEKKFKNEKLKDGYDPLLGPLYPNGDPVFPYMTDYESFRFGVEHGYFEGNPTTGKGQGVRSAALFVHNFVSDHFPLVVEFT